MPLINIQTSVLLPDDEQEKLAVAASGVVARVLGKSERYVMSIVGEGTITMGGKIVPGAFVDVRSIGGLDGEINSALARELSVLLANALDVSPENLYLNFTNVPAGHWGWNGETFG